MQDKDISILFVDDEESELNALKRNLILEPYHFLYATNGIKALHILSEQQVHIVVTDMRMPQMDGLSLLKQIKYQSPMTIRMVLSGYSELSSIIPAINTGEIYRYITKPIEPDLFKKTLKDAVGFYLLNQDRQKLVDSLQKRNQELTLALEEKKNAEESLKSAQSRIEDTLLQGRIPDGFKNVKISVLSRSARNIGGDFHEIIQTLPNGFDVLLGDVMGKGILAALVGAGTKQHFLKALGRRDKIELNNKPLSPALLTQQVQNDITPGLFDLESFVTSIYARIDIDRKTMVFSDCGHAPILHYVSDKKRCEELKGHNTPLGVVKEEVIKETEVLLNSGDLLVFLSDGIIETRSPENDYYGIKRLCRFIETHHKLTPDKLIAELDLRLESFRESKDLEDDMTCICIAMGELNTKDYKESE